MVEGQLWYNLNHSLGDNGFHVFLKTARLQVNAITRLDFELTN